MQVTLFSFFSALGWSSLLIIAIYLLRRTRLRRYFGILTMVLLYLFCAVRLLLPLEFPHTLVVEDSVVYPRVYDLLVREHDPVAHQPVGLLLCAIWLAGTVVLLCRYVGRYGKAVRSVTRYAQLWDARTAALLTDIQRQAGRTIKVQGFFAENIDSAFGIGVLRKRIILPRRTYTETELRYILLHEYTHFLNHDTAVKLLVSLFCIVFWWNPVVYLLRRDLEQTLELKCDLSITRTMSAPERTAYLRTILAAMKQSHGRHEQPLPQTSAALFRADADEELKERFAAVMAYPPQAHCRLNSAVLVGLCAALLLASYAVLPQPVFDAPVTEGRGTINFDSSNAHIRQDADGTKWLCIDDEAPIRLTEAEAAFYQETLHFRFSLEDVTGPLPQ